MMPADPEARNHVNFRIVRVGIPVQISVRGPDLSLAGLRGRIVE